jgi:hypothetical protein
MTARPDHAAVAQGLADGDIKKWEGYTGFPLTYSAKCRRDKHAETRKEVHLAMSDRIAGYKLIETGYLVNFDVVDTKIDESVGGDEALVRIDLLLGEQEDEDQRSEDHAP